MIPTVLNKRRLILLVFPLFFLFSILFHQQIVIAIVKHYLSSKNTQLKGMEISFKKLGYHDGSLFLEQVTLAHPSLTASRIAIDKFQCQIGFLKRDQRDQTLYDLYRPVIDLDLANMKHSEEKINLYEIVHALSYFSKVSIHEGKIQLLTSQGKFPFFFCYEAPKDLADLGSFKLFLSVDQKIDPDVSIKLTKEIDKIHLELKIASIDLEKKELLNSRLSEIEKGVLSGVLGCTINSEGKIIKADALLQGLALQMKFEETSRLYIDKLLLDGGFENHEAVDPSSLLTLSALDSFKPHLQIFGLEGVYAKDEILFPLFQNGSLDLKFKSQDIFTSSFLGDIDGKVCFGFDGIGSFHSLSEWSLQLVARENFSDFSSLQSFSLIKQNHAPLGLEICAYQIDCDKLRLYLKKFPFLSPWPIKIDKGLLSGKLTLFFENSRVKKGAFRDVVIEEADFSVEEKNLHAHIKTLTAEGVFDFPFSLYSLSSFSCSFSEISLGMEGSDTPFYCAGSLNYKDCSFCDSFVKIETKGAVAESLITGSFEDIKTFFHIKLFQDHPYSHLQKKILQRADRLEPLSSVEGELLFKVKEDVFEISTKLDLFYTTFSEAILASSFFNRQWKYIKTTFSSEKVSPSTYLAFLEYYHQRWYVLGDMKIEGQINPEKISFEIDASQAFFDSEDITVFMDQAETLHHGNFNFDLNAKKWWIHLPIQKGRCIDKKLHLPFENVFADVIIEGATIRASHLVAECESIAFEGEVIVDFSDKEWNDLKLYPCRMEGRAQDFLTFLSYIPGFEQAKNLDCISGVIKGDSNNSFFIKYSDTAAIKEAKIVLNADDVSLDLPSFCELEQVSFGLQWDLSSHYLEIKELEGLVKKMEQSMVFRAPLLCCKNLILDQWEFDLRLENPTHDLVRLVGKTAQEEGDLRVDFAPFSNQILGGNMEIVQCLFSTNGTLKRAKGLFEISTQQGYKILEFITKLGFLELENTFFEGARLDKKQGHLTFDLDYSIETKELNIKAVGSQILFGDYFLDDLEASLSYSPSRIRLKNLKTPLGFLQVDAYCASDHIWHISHFRVEHLRSFLNATEGSYQNKIFQLSKVTSNLFLEDIRPLLNKYKPLEAWLEGTLRIDSELAIDITNGPRQMLVIMKGSLQSEKISKGELTLDPASSFECEYSLGKNFIFRDLSLKIFKKENQALYLETFAKKIELSSGIHMEGFSGVIPPEMLSFLVKEELVYGLSFQEGFFKFQNTEFRWDNELDFQCDLSSDPSGLYFQIKLKQGYYWVYEHSLWIDHFFLNYDHGSYSSLIGIDDQGVSLDLFFNYDPKQEGSFLLSLKEGHDKDLPCEKGLAIVSKYLDQEGMVIQSVEGSLYGLDVSLRKNSRAYSHDKMMLTGQIKVDTKELLVSLPDRLINSLKSLEMGSGYELSGDWVIDKKNLSHSSFKGFLKGRDLQLMGYEFKTLLSQIEIHATSVQIQDFCLSDLSGVLKIPEIKITKQELGEWHVKIPDLSLQDFRPSRMKKQDTSEEKVKPFIIKELHFGQVEGIIGSKESFQGKGFLEFINTFKTEMNIFDIPVEILARIGFDPGIFVPVIGKLELEMKEGKIFLKELKNTFSEGKRSKFYLSSYKDSYIDLDGHLFIDIKMKQYVLLKITEPFTLSIRGTLSKPKYSLR